MTTKPGDTRILAEWLAEWEPRADGEYHTDDQEYKTQICQSVEEAKKVAAANDYHDEGSVLIQEYQHTDFGLYDWFTIEEFNIWDIPGEVAR